MSMPKRSCEKYGLNTLSKTCLFVIDENHWTHNHPLDVIHTNLFLHYKLVIIAKCNDGFQLYHQMVCQFMCWHWLISYFDTNITLFPYWKTASRQLVVNTQSTYCQFCGTTYGPFPHTKSLWSMFGQFVFSPSFLHSFNNYLREQQYNTIRNLWSYQRVVFPLLS